MRSFIVGTAGHIDHGKSALVRALTGTDPDRLKEEQERGITIDLGFAHLPLDDALVASFIDVPGHERFVRNMLAGAHGIDAVLLVIAADESVMPQTREHFHICRLLGIERGIVALTKCDLADPELQALAEIEVRELAKDSFLEGAPIVRVSAQTGAGLAELRAQLAELAKATSARSLEGLLRLPIDRVFTMKGFGTVVTGTLISGELEAGAELEILPSGRRTRARGIQVHGAAVEAVAAPSRVAVNLTGIEVEQLERGEVLARPGTLLPSSIMDVQISLIRGERALKDQARVRVHVASAELLARARILGGSAAIESGGAGLAQLRFERPAVAGHGDRLILRSYSPATTIGGAFVLDPLSPKRRSRDPQTLERVAGLRTQDPARAAALMVAAGETAGVSASVLAARVTRPLSWLVDALSNDASILRLGQEPGAFISRSAADELASRTRSRLEEFHAAQPLKAAMSREELRRRVFARAPAGAFEQVLAGLAAAGELRLVDQGVALGRHAVTLSPEEQSARETLLAAALESGLEGLDLRRAAGATGKDLKLLERISKVLLSEGSLRRVGEDLLIHVDALDMLVKRVRERWPPGSRLDVAVIKQLTGLSRKYVIPLLEYLDRVKVTRRAGNERVVLP